MTPRHYSGLGSDLNLGPGNTHTYGFTFNVVTFMYT